VIELAPDADDPCRRITLDDIQAKLKLVLGLELGHVESGRGQPRQKQRQEKMADCVRGSPCGSRGSREACPHYTFPRLTRKHSQKTANDALPIYERLNSLEKQFDSF
jgi:hypothetical protein